MQETQKNTQKRDYQIEKDVHEYGVTCTVFYMLNYETVEMFTTNNEAYCTTLGESWVEDGIILRKND